MLVYHYTTERNWRMMRDGISRVDPLVTAYHGVPIPNVEHVRGLYPFTPIVPQESFWTPPGASRRAAFCLLEPRPQGWTDPHIWVRLMAHTKPHVLLEVELNGEEAYVLEGEYSMRPPEPDNSFECLISRVMGHNVWSYRKYWDSRVPLEHYDGSYELPEVAICEAVPLERISLAD